MNEFVQSNMIFISFWIRHWLINIFQLHLVKGYLFEMNDTKGYFFPNRQTRLNNRDSWIGTMGYNDWVLFWTCRFSGIFQEPRDFLPFVQSHRYPWITPGYRRQEAENLIDLVHSFLQTLGDSYKQIFFAFFLNTEYIPSYLSCNFT